MIFELPARRRSGSYYVIWLPLLLSSNGSFVHRFPKGMVEIISHVLNEKGTGYECLKSIGMKSESYHTKEHTRLIQIEKFERDGGKGKSMVGL